MKEPLAVVSTYRARRELATLIRRVQTTGVPICIGVKGKPKMILVPAEDDTTASVGPILVPDRKAV